MPIIESTPADIEYEKLVLFQYSQKKFEDAQNLYDSLKSKGEKGIEFASVPIREPNTVVQIAFNGVLVTDGIKVSEQFGNHQVGFSFSDPSDHEAIVGLYDVFKYPSLDDWEEKSFIKNDTIWFKLKVDKNAYTFANNKKLNARKPGESNMVAGESISIIATPRAYFNFETKSYGISFTVNRFTVN